jgi:hypothetical protein
MELRDLIPPFVVESLRQRLVAGVADAEAHYEYSKADEDSLTGALGHAISRLGPIVASDGPESYTVRTYYKKIRGRGPGAPEHSTGADGLFQIEVSDENDQSVWKKGLPFQAKKDWRGSDVRLSQQAADMIDTADQGLVIDYSPNGYRACRASVAVEHRGRASSVRTAGEFRALGQMLGNDFLDCTVGVEGLSYDSAEEVFLREGHDFHIIGATIRKRAARRKQKKSQ